jgi:CotH protein.
MNKNRDWVLLAEYCDKSLMRTTYMNALSRAAGAEWTPASTHVDLFLNGKYNGTYLLIEQVEKAKHKVQMEDDGFFIEDDGYYSWEPFYFSTSVYGRNYTFKYPDTGNGDIVKGDASYNFILKYMNDMEASLNSSTFKDPDKGYRKYLDVPSFAKWYLVMEVLGDHDPNFFYVLPTRNGKMRMYPVWDAEWTLGNASAGPGGWQHYPAEPLYKVTTEMYRNRKYFSRLFKDPYFVEQVYLEWQKMKKNLDTVRKEVADETENIKYSQKDNFTRWPELYQYPISVNIVFDPEWRWKDYSKYAEDWFEDRLVWFDSYIQSLYDDSRQ